MEDSTFFLSSTAPGTFGFTPSEHETNTSLSAFPFFTSPPTLSPYQTMERSKMSAPFLASTMTTSKVLAESFDAALQALSRQSAPTDIFSATDPIQKRPGLPLDFKKPASSIGSSAPSSATSDASDVLADRLDSDFDPDLSADSISLGSNQSGFESWSISPSPVLGNNLALPDGLDAPQSAAPASSASTSIVADIFAQFIAEDTNGETSDTIRGLPIITPQRPSIFRDFSALTCASSASTMSIGSSPATPLDGEPLHKQQQQQQQDFGLFLDMGSPRKSMSTGPRPQLLERAHSQMEAGPFANMPFGAPPAPVSAQLVNAGALFAEVPPHASSPMPSPAFMAYTVQPAMLSCNPAHIAPSEIDMGRKMSAQQQQQQQQQHQHHQHQASMQPAQQLVQTEAVPLLRLDAGLMNSASSPTKRSADSQKTIGSSKPSKRAKSESVEPQVPTVASQTSAVPTQMMVSSSRLDGGALFAGDALGEDRPSPVRAVPGFIAQTFPAPSMYLAADIQPDWAAAAAAAKCVNTANRACATGVHGSSSGNRTAVLGPAAAAACAASASGNGVQPTPIPVKALIGQHSAATLAHGRPVITATVPLPAYSGIITKRSRGRRVPNDPLEMQNLGKGGKIWTCLVPECGKCFRRSEHLKRHIRSIHTEERPYMCPFPGCKKGFSRHDNLNQHARVHQMADGDAGSGSSSVGMVPSMSSSSGSGSMTASSSASSMGRKRKQPGDLDDEESMTANEEQDDELEE
ncbi:hypothetical protein OC844_000801 [Tilletia horrida]|nr:hypothetical protein OC844_000801 [Tilletia horrida]